MEERIQKILAVHGGVSRRAAEKLISEGLVTVNGIPASLGAKADPDRDTICLRGEMIDTSKEQKYYIMLHKPVGYVTTMSDEKGRKTVAELVSDIPARVYPVGRLDISSEGLLLMTNDGEFANRIMHPSFEKEKTYRVLVTGDIKSGVKRLLEPMELDGVPIHPPRVRIISQEDDYPATLDITIHEGKNRQIRRMCEAADLRVKRLIRISVGSVRLGQLKKGTWRHLTQEELGVLCKK